MKIGNFIGFVYLTTCLVNGKIYIGQHEFTSNNISDGYLGSGLKLVKAVKKYGKENFKRKILRLCKTKRELDIWEKVFIKKYKSQNEDIGYNICNGVFFVGNENISKREDIRKLISEKMKGRTPSVETRRKMRLAKIKGGVYKGVNNPNYGNHKLRGENHPMYGKHHSEESRRKIKERAIHDFKTGKRKPSMLGKHLSDETKRKLSIANSGENSSILGKFWINNGAISKYWDDEKTIPSGWRRGRIVNWSTSKQL